MLRQIRQRGFRYTAAILFNRIVPEWFFRYRGFVVYQLRPDETVQAQAVVETFLCSQEDSQTTEDLEKLTGYCRRSSDEFLIGAKCQQQLAGGMWGTNNKFLEAELGVEIQLAESQWWMFAAYVDKAWRRRGIYSRILVRTCDEVTKRGGKVHLVAVNPLNRGSNAVHSRQSIRTVGFVRALRFLKTTVCLTQGEIDRNQTLSWNSTRKPILLRIKDRAEPRA